MEKKEMKVKEIFKDVNIDSVNFINNKNDLRIEFRDSIHNSGKLCDVLICLDIKTLHMTTSEDEDLRFPQVICDVYAVEKDEKIYVSFMGGNYEFEIVCTDIEVV